MNSKKLLYLKLVGSIERWMDSGDPVLTLKYLLDAADGDIGMVQSCLKKWQLEDRIDWLKSLNMAKPNEEVVRFKKYIKKDIDWRQ